MASGLTLPTPPPHHMPDMTAHKTAAQLPYTPTNTPERQVYMATGTSTWHTGKRHNITPPRCLCRLEAPSMPHLLWKCTALQTQRRQLAPRPPQNTSEERLLAAVTPPDPRPLHPTNQAIQAPHDLRPLLEQQFNQAVLCGQPLVIATDGGAKHGLATWAVAVDTGTFARPLRGEDNTAMMAELTAIWCVLITIILVVEQSQAQCDLQVILAVDCQSAIDFLDRVSVPTQHFHLWHGFQQHRRRAMERGLRILFQWTPAHNKHTEWRPTYGCPTHLRHLNHQADRAAAAALQRELICLQPWLDTVARALQWSSAALKWAARVAAIWDGHCATLANISSI